jgi:hypothetical protein
MTHILDISAGRVGYAPIFEILRKMDSKDLSLRQEINILQNTLSNVQGYVQEQVQQAIIENLDTAQTLFAPSQPVFDVVVCTKPALNLSEPMADFSTSPLGSIIVKGPTGFLVLHPPPANGYVLVTDDSAVSGLAWKLLAV